jgi:hypothetical protein
MDTVWMTKEVVQFIRSMGTDHEGVIDVSESAERFVSCPFECVFLEVLQEGVGNYK